MTSGNVYHAIAYDSATGGTNTITWGGTHNTTTSNGTCNDYIVYLQGVNAALINDIQQWYVPKGRRGRRKVVPPHADMPIRQPPPAAFNRYINGSDLLQEFIRFLGQHRVRKGEALKMSLELFIQWLIIEAAKADNEEPPIQLRLPAPKLRCLQCKRILRRKTAIMLCSNACVMRQLRAA